MEAHVGKPSIVLIIPNTRWFGKRLWLCLPYAALLLTDILKETYAFSIIDANGEDLDESQVAARIVACHPRVIMVTAGSVEYYRQAHKALEIAKGVAPEAVTILGGIYPTVLAEEAAKDTNADWLFMYHAEERIGRFLDLVLSGRTQEASHFPGIAFRDADGRIVETPLDQHIGAVKRMAKPDYSLVDLRPYLRENAMGYQFNTDRPAGFVITSYGCPNNCLFCASRTISGRRTVFRPVEDVLEEIAFLHREHGVGNIIFLDDALLLKRKRLLALLDGMMRLDSTLRWKAASVAAWQLDDELLTIMHDTGCEQLTISVESGSQHVIDEVIHKPLKLDIVPGIVRKCREVGIDIGANFVIGLPGETWEDIRETFRFAELCDFDVAHFHIATPLPKTDMYKICKEKGYLPEDFSFLDQKFLGFAQGFITTEDFTPFELAVVRAFEWDRINFATPEKCARVARLYKCTPEMLHEHRKQTRRKLGLQIEADSYSNVKEGAHNE